MLSHEGDVLRGAKGGHEEAEQEKESSGEGDSTVKTHYTHGRSSQERNAFTFKLYVNTYLTKI